MSETTDAMRKAGKPDPALAAIQELSDSVATSFEVLETGQKRATESAKEQVAEVKKDLQSTRDEMAAGFKVHSDKLHTLDRRSVAIGIGGFKDVEGVCLAALSEDDRKYIGIVDWMMPRASRNREAFPILSTPVGATLVAMWLHKSFLIQKRRYTSKDHENRLFADLARYEKALREAFPNLEMAAALDTTSDTGGLGGHWLPEPVAAELYRMILDNSIIGSLATHVPMTTKTLDLPVEGSSGLTVTWGSENTNITDSVPASAAVSKVTLTASRLNGFAQSSLEEIQDSPVSILNWVQTKLVEMAGRAIDQQILEGATDPFVGLSTNAGVNGVTTGANGDAFGFGVVTNLVFKARERASREGAMFFLSPELMGKVVGLRADAVSAADGAGQPIFQFANVPGPIQFSILGFPAVVHSAIKADRTYGTGTGLSHLYFGPPRQIVVGDRMGMSWDVSDAPGFQAATVSMRLITRLAIAVAVPKAFSRHTNLKAV